ncbi:MAG: heavy metal translocating P-type ATPase [Rhodanobacter sp.]|nr:MAG: heavy metal translocating P-type ATPase [Rhodanobacter sp.]
MSGSHAAWAHPQLAAQVLHTRHDGCSEIALRVELLRDARQALHIEQVIRSLPGIQRIAIDRIAHRMRVVWDSSRTSLPTLLDAFAEANCPAQPLRYDSIDDARSSEMHDLLKRLLVAGMCAMQVMTYAFVIYIGVVDFVDFSTRNLFRWLGLMSTIPLVFYSARPFFVGTMHELGARRLGINLPIALAVALVFLASTWNTLRGGGEIYFDSISMFVFLLLGARYLELRARHRSSALGDAAIDASPLLAQRRCDSGELETVAAVTLLPGDRVHIPEGSTVPADGVLEDRIARVDEALLSGESRPVLHRRGARLIAGSILLSGSVDLRVTASGKGSTTAQLSALASRTREARSPATTSNDREASRFVGRILLLTLATAIGWLLVDPTRAFDATIAVLVVACPCAFALTLPVTLTRALGTLARHGVLVTDSTALAALARIDCALFDKTGTLSVPRLDTAAIESLHGDDPAQLLQLAAVLAGESSHPLARAVAEAARQAHVVLPVRPAGVEVTAGGGISALIDGRRLRLGHAAFALELSGKEPPARLDGTLVLADIQGALAAFPLDEQPRDDARGTLEALRAAGVVPCIVSGDSRERVAAMAARLGVTDWSGRQTSADKLRLLRAKQAEGHGVLAIGDGGNDAPILAGADVSAALTTGTELAQAQADLLLLDGRLDGLVRARTVSRQVQHVVVQSRRWALAYNFFAIPFAAFGLVPPWLAGIGMSASSLVVVLNALRVGRREITKYPELHG